MRQMLQTLLAARFQMSSHREMKPQPVFALVVAKNGPKLARAKTDTCTDSTMARPCGGFRIANRSSMWGDTVTVKQLAGELLHGDGDRKSTRLNSSHIPLSRMPSSA